MLLQMLDEMLPKATGREARVEKKKVRAEKRREKEYSPGIHLSFGIELKTPVHHTAQVSTSPLVWS